MILSYHMRPMALCLFAFTLLTPFGCKSEGGEGASQSGAGISGPLTMLPEYQARAPRTCATVKSPPSAAQATVMVQCTMDGLSATGLGLIQDVKLEVGSSRPTPRKSRSAPLSAVPTSIRVPPTCSRSSASSETGR